MFRSSHRIHCIDACLSSSRNFVGTYPELCVKGLHSGHSRRAVFLGRCRSPVVCCSYRSFQNRNICRPSELGGCRILAVPAARRPDNADCSNDEDDLHAPLKQYQASFNHAWWRRWISGAALGLMFLFMAVLQPRPAKAKDLRYEHACIFAHRRNKIHSVDSSYNNSLSISSIKGCWISFFKISSNNLPALLLYRRFGLHFARLCKLVFF